MTAEAGESWIPPDFHEEVELPARRAWGVDDLVALDLMYEELEREVVYSYRPQLNRDETAPVADEAGGYVANCPACWPAPGAVRLVVDGDSFTAEPVGPLCRHSSAEVMAALTSVAPLNRLVSEAWSDVFYRWCTRRYVEGYSAGYREARGSGKSVTAGEVLSGAAPPVSRRRPDTKWDARRRRRR